MEIVRWSYENLHVPMLRDKDNNLWCTSKQLGEALGITLSGIRSVYERHADEFEALSVSECDAKETLLKNKVELGIKRVKSDMILWSENDMILVAILSKSNTSKQFRRELVKFVKSNATRGFARQEDVQNLLITVGQLTCELEAIKKLMNPNKSVHLRLVQ